MLIWDKKFLETLEKAARNLDWDLHLMRRYVDDSNCVSDEMPPGARFDARKKKVVIKTEYVEPDKEVPPDQRSALVVQAVANSLFPFIQMEIDCPSMNECGKVPILDLQVNIVSNKVDMAYTKSIATRPLSLYKNPSLAEVSPARFPCRA